MQVFYFDLSKISYGNLLSSCTLILSLEEKQRFQEIKTQYRQKVFLASRLLTRTILSKLLGCNTEELIFETNSNHRPTLKNSSLDFNLSHSKDLVLFALSPSLVGIDVEFMKERDYFELAQYFCTDNELEVLKTTNLKGEYFYTLWTQKEALVKALGKSIFDIQTLQLHSEYNFQITSMLVMGQYILSIAHKERKQEDFKLLDFYMYHFC